MTNQSDIQPPIFSSYKGMNEFSYCFSVKNESVTITPKKQAGLIEFVKKTLKNFDKYNIPKLKCEVLGHHLKNLYSVLHELCKTPPGGKICLHCRRCSNPGVEPPSVELTSEQKQIKININKIRRELARFPRLNFLEEAFDSYFKQIEKKP